MLRVVGGVFSPRRAEADAWERRPRDLKSLSQKLTPA